LSLFDWIIVILLTATTMVVGFFFHKRATKNIQSFFLSDRKLSWVVAGVSMSATMFASDTPLWVTSLVREYGICYVWQYWAPFIGCALAAVLFARLWRRMGVMTDVEFIECRYSGRTASVLRIIDGSTQALFFCPLIIGWVIKAMEAIARETMGLPIEYRLFSTVSVVALALVMCTMSGLWGVVYASLFQFAIAVVGTLVFAYMSVRYVGGLSEMVAQLSTMESWSGHSLNIVPSIGENHNQMSAWNALGYFGILWWVVASPGGYQAQKILACRSTRDSSLAVLLYTIMYYGLLCWPWILIALCSMIIFKELPQGVTNDSIYPRMVVTVLPSGMRGLLVASFVAAFISTVSTLFNWGSSYLVNDVYKRFFVVDGSDRHYIYVAKITTLIIGFIGGLISFLAKDIQQLLTISFVILSGRVAVSILRWFWWRINASGDLAATIAAWVLAFLLLFVKIFDKPVQKVFRLDKGVLFSSDPDLLGARMLFMVILVTMIAVIVSYLTKPTEKKCIKAFVEKARPPRFFWRPIIEKFDCQYHEEEKLGQTLVSWFIATLCVGSLIFGIGKILLGYPLIGTVLGLTFLISLWITIKRIS